MIADYRKARTASGAQNFKRELWFVGQAKCKINYDVDITKRYVFQLISSYIGLICIGRGGFSDQPNKYTDDFHYQMRILRTSMT